MLAEKRADPRGSQHRLSKYCTMVTRTIRACHYHSRSVGVAAGLNTDFETVRRTAFEVELLCMPV
jgi:hypothetical protein